MYRNINTGVLWTLEEIKSEYENFKHETSITFEETMKDFEEVQVSPYAIYEEVGGDVCVDRIEAENDADAIAEARATFESLSDHDKKRRVSFELVRNITFDTLECDEIILKFK